MRSSSAPQVQTYIVVKGQRQTIYTDGAVYLEDGAEFEIEFVNTSHKTALPEITINGEKLKAGPIIYPNQTYFLKDFITLPKRFTFVVYSADADDADIKNNGVIEIEFYYQQEPRPKAIDSEQYARAFSATKNQDAQDQTETGKIIGGSDSNVNYKTQNIDTDYTYHEYLRLKLLPQSRLL